MNGTRGFTLVEVLVALVVLAVALLGLAGLQLTSLQGAHVAYQRALGTLAAHDAGERLWEWQANRRFAGDDFACPNATQLKNEVEADWEQAWGDLLPDFDQSELLLAGSCGVEVKARWRDDRFGGASGEAVSQLDHRVSLPNG